MAKKSASRDYEAFARLVRQRRLDLGLRQEALALSALGNPDRKSFVSAIENTRLNKITPATAQKLSGALGLTREDVPTTLRWPSSDFPSPIEQRLSVLEARAASGDVPFDDQAKRIP
ncbi:MAG: helix-turn-helix transcriptional regulator [Pseudomonadota bacterium]